MKSIYVTDRNNQTASFTIYKKETDNQTKQLNRTKTTNAAYYLTPFLIDLLQIQRSKTTDAISKCIVDLDQLALNVDADIDSNDLKLFTKIDISFFAALDTRITDCFSYLNGEPDLNLLIAKTFEAVEKSLQFNTSGRKYVYSLEKIEYGSCTTYYLFPLLNYLNELSPLHKDITKISFLISNYIQILDDYIDVAEDIAAANDTPLTKLRYATNFDFFSKKVFALLRSYFLEIKKEASSINPLLTNNLFKGWQQFQEMLLTIKIPSGNDETQNAEFIKIIHRQIPPIVCYT